MRCQSIGVWLQLGSLLKHLKIRRKEQYTIIMIQCTIECTDCGIIFIYDIVMIINHAPNSCHTTPYTMHTPYRVQCRVTLKPVWCVYYYHTGLCANDSVWEIFKHSHTDSYISWKRASRIIICLWQQWYYLLFSNSE